MFDDNEFAFSEQVFLRLPALDAVNYKTDRLGTVLRSDIFKNALWLAAPDFYQELEKKGFDAIILTGKERLTALKFYNRMSFRATPFGAFAAFTLIPWISSIERQPLIMGKRTLHILPAIRWEKIIRSERSLRCDLPLSVNPTLYRFNDGWRYTRYEEELNAKLSFYGYALAYNDADAMLLKHLQEKSLKKSELAVFLENLTDCSTDEAISHIENLCAEQVLISSEEITLLLNYESDKELANPKSFVYEEGLKLAQKVRLNTPVVPENFNGKFLYAGLEQTYSNGGLSEDWQKEILKGLHALALLCPDPQDGPLQQYRDAFKQKFGDRVVPLLEALDPDMGLDYDGLQQPDGHELLRGLDFQQKQQKIDRVAWTPIHHLLLQKWTRNPNRETYAPISLASTDLASLTAGSLKLPPSLTVLFSISARQLVLHTAGGVTATAISGRFSAFSDGFHQLCQATAAMEEQANPGVCFTELVQISHNNIDNINRRRQVYRQAIPLNSFPDVTDMLPTALGLMATGNELILVHLPTGKRVIPRLPTAFNYHNNDMPVFRFLCDLQSQSIKTNLALDPEKIFPGLDFYPRVTFENIIFSLARWHLGKEDLAELTERPLSISRMRLFCEKRGIPALITAGRGDQKLTFDLSKDDEAHFFLESLRDPANSTITELLPGEHDSSPLTFNASAEYLATMINKKQVYLPFKPERLTTHTITRDFAPGSEWIYVKIYCTPQSAEQLLLQTLLPWVRERGQVIRSWFFVRYHDPSSHLRFRIRVPLADVRLIQSELQSLLNRSDVRVLISKIYFDTYQRELERYTPQLIEHIESIFHLGSEEVVRYLTAQTLEDESNKLVWPVIHCYELLKNFLGDNETEMGSLSERTAELFFQEHGGEKKLKLSMDKRYRELRPALDQAQRSDFADVTRNRLFKEIRELSFVSEGLGTATRHQFIADIIHMQVNRIFISDQRKFEALIWHCLSKMARSAKAMHQKPTNRYHLSN